MYKVYVSARVDAWAPSGGLMTSSGLMAMASLARSSMDADPPRLRAKHANLLPRRPPCRAAPCLLLLDLFMYGGQGWAKQTWAALRCWAHLVTALQVNKEIESAHLIL